VAAAAALACASVPLPERQGVVLYRKKCGACHRPYAPSEIRPAEWEKTFAEMKRRAKLTDAEVAEIRAYVEPDLAPSHAAARSAP
jgi:mono/diheme cytochrome c family protein